MVLAGLLGALLTMNVVRAADRTQPVLVAATDLAPGTVIGDGAVRVAHIHADEAVLSSLVAGKELDRVRGQVASAPLHKGSLVSREAVRPAASGVATRVMSFPLARARAVGGKLTSGDRVDMLAVEHDTGRSGYVVTGVTVVGVDGRGSGPLGTSNDVTVSVAVDPESAGRIASALEVSAVTLVRATGASPANSVQPFLPTAQASSNGVGSNGGGK
jgi:pilus assembly protein CpaB